MKIFWENLSKVRELIMQLVGLSLVVLVIIGFYIYYTTFYVIVRFNELGPLSKNMSVYYNGFRVGRIVKIEPDRDFKHTLAKVNLIGKNLNLPQNMTVAVERFPNGELYLQLVYPQSPSLRMLKRGDILEGIAPYSLEQFMLGQSVSGMTDMVSIHIIKALNAADAANQEMKLFFRTTSDVLKQNDKGISASVNNTEAMTRSLAQMAENLNQISKKLNDSIDEQGLKTTTTSIKQATENVAKATEDIDKTVKKIDDTITQANAAASNLNSITAGLNDTLGKRFGGMRVMFGTPVKQDGEIKNACK